MLKIIRDNVRKYVQDNISIDSNHYDFFPVLKVCGRLIIGERCFECKTTIDYPRTKTVQFMFWSFGGEIRFPTKEEEAQMKILGKEQNIKIITNMIIESGVEYDRKT